MTLEVDLSRLERCSRTAQTALLDERASAGHWEGRLSTSALSTATAVMALEQVRRHREKKQGASPSQRLQQETTPCQEDSPTPVSNDQLARLIQGGLYWLSEHQNDDGGWGDTTKSVSNISTTMLAHAVFHATGTVEDFSIEDFSIVVQRAKDYIDRVGGVEAVRARYGKDKTFSVPILTHCALAGLVDWEEVSPLPFELACLPPEFYKTVRLPVVSYALPALIAIGQARYFHRRPWNPMLRIMRALSVKRSLKVLENIQPSNGGFLEATPLTSFVTMSLASMGLIDHPVTQRGLSFIVDSVLDDGSWPIDTNLATWVTTLSVNALKEDLPEESAISIQEWLVNQQYRSVHPYTNADPGGWAWTDLPGGVPDADDTPGALLALLELNKHSSATSQNNRVNEALQAGIGWLLDLQNRDGGWPTFCRGWGSLPFDRSSADISAHVLRAFSAYLQQAGKDGKQLKGGKPARIRRAMQRAFAYLQHVQKNDGSWLPLWFGNQFAENDENPTYGTARVLAAYRDTGSMKQPPAQRAVQWLLKAQNNDGGWGGAPGIESSVEETALAVDVLIDVPEAEQAVSRGLNRLMDQVEAGTFRETTPIGFYFAKLWYFERLYPLIFTASALTRIQRSVHSSVDKAESLQQRDQQPKQQALLD